MSIVKNVFDRLQGHEGEGDDVTSVKTGKIGVTQSARDAVGNPDASDEEVAELYLDKLFGILSKDLKGYSEAPNEIQELLLDLSYNMGERVKDFKGIKTSLANKDYEGVLKNTLDTANSEGKTVKGIARRRADNFNRASKNIKISKVEQKKDGEIVYHTKDGEYLSYGKGKGTHQASKPGIMNIGIQEMEGLNQKKLEPVSRKSLLKKLAEGGVRNTEELDFANKSKINQQLHEEQLKEAYETEELSFGRALIEDISKDSLFASIGDYAERIGIVRESYDDESDDKLLDLGNQETLSHYMEGLPSSDIALFEGITTEREADFVKQRQLEKYELTKQINNKSGFTKFLIDSLDPAQVAFIAATGGLGSLTRVSSTGRNVVKYSGLGVLEEVAYEAALDATTAGYEADYKSAAILGATLGGLVGIIDSRFVNNGTSKKKKTKIKDMIKCEGKK